MYSLTIENKSGQQIALSSEKNITITGIEGLVPPVASIVTSSVAMHDGSKFNSARVEPRNIVIHLRLTNDVERTRITLYKYFRIKQWCKIYYSNDSRNVYCEGYVEAFENDRFAMSNEIMISILCPSPWFKEIDEIVFNMSQLTSEFEFPFAIETVGVEFSSLTQNVITPVINSGDVETGLILELSSTDEVVNPRIYNTDTQELLGLDFTMIEGDLIRISTVKGEKYVKLIRDGVETNIINRLMRSSTWFQIPVGETNFTYTCTSGRESFSVKFIGRNLFEGV